MADVDSMSIKALKELIASAGLSTDDCIDKNDLKARAREALAAKVPAASSDSVRSQKTLGGYPCLVKGSGEADMLIIALHGLGASNGDLADVPSLLGQIEPSLASARLLEVYPQAPQGPMGPAWWNFDVMGFMQAQSAPPGPEREKLTAQLIRRKPDGLDAARTQMKALLAEARAIAGGANGPLPLNRVLLAGFSLGAITALDLALHLEEATVGGVLFMNGAPIVVEEWAARLEVHKSLRVHISGGRTDAVLPCECVGWVRQLLQSKGVEPIFQLHPGGHEVGGPEVLKSIAKFAASIIAADK